MAAKPVASRLPFGAAIISAVLLAACSSSAAPTVSPSAAAAVPSPATGSASGNPSGSATTASGGPSGSSSVGSGKAFVMTGVLPAFPQVVDGNLDPTTFVTSIPSNTPEVYVLYLLGAGFNGAVDATWTDTDDGTSFKENAAPLAFPGSTPNWEWFSNDVSNGALKAGKYSVTFTFVPTGETATATFSVVGSSAAGGSPGSSSAPLPSGSAFTLLTTGTSVDPSQSAPDPSTFASTFPMSATAIYVIYTLRDGLLGKLSCQATEDGTLVYGPVEVTYGSDNSWGDFEIHAANGFSAGSFEATITFEPTGETETVDFVVQ